MLNLIRSDIAVAAPEPSTETVARALATLTPSDLVRLKRLAQLRARLLPGLEWDELLNEALLRALDGSRRWPEGVPLLTFLAGITLPAWYWAPWQSVHGTRFHGYQLGYFPNGPHGHPGYGLYIDTLPKALLAAAVSLRLRDTDPDALAGQVQHGAVDIDCDYPAGDLRHFYCEPTVATA